MYLNTFGIRMPDMFAIMYGGLIQDRCLYSHLEKEYQIYDCIHIWKRNTRYMIVFTYRRGLSIRYMTIFTYRRGLSDI